MGAATTRFFRDLDDRGHDAAVEHARGTIRFDLTEPDGTTSWLLRMDAGDLSASRDSSDADCVLTSDAALFDAIAAGDANALTALLRGAATFDGDATLLLAFRRLLPDPREPES
jgi:predicted lipid carrier protein YhbT